MSLKYIILYTLLTIFAPTASSQGFILLVSNMDCNVTIDGETTEQLSKNTPKKITLSSGEHYLLAQAASGEQISEVIVIENEKQKVLKIEFGKQPGTLSETSPLTPSKAPQDGILVADLELTLTGGVNALSNEGLSEYANNSELYYAFEKGDEILIDGDIQNKKGKFFIQLLKYPEWTPIYTKQNLEKLEGHHISISERSIYVIRIGTSAFFNKTLKLTIKRKPAGENTRVFNTTVVKKTRYNAVKLVEPSHHYVNSTSNETWKGGTNEVVIPLTAPPDALEWYYIVSASRTKQEIESNLKTVSLLNDLTEVLNGIDPTTTALNIGLNLIAQPPGSDYCDVYLLDYNNQALFSSDKQFQYILEGSRENVKSAKVKVTCCTGIQYYLGIQNRDMYHGIHIGIEVVGIKKEEYLDFAE